MSHARVTPRPLTASFAALAIAAMTQTVAAQDVTVSHGYSNFGALKYGPDEPFSYVNQDAPKGGEISFSTVLTFDSFNQFSRKGVSESTASTILFEDIMIAAADDPYSSYCYLCTTIEYPENLDWVVVNLREDVTFANGTPMTAEDIKFTVDLLVEQGIPEFRQVIQGYFKSVEVTGPYQVRFEFNDAAPVRDRVGLVGLWNPFSKAWFEETGARLDESTNVPFMGTGPYMLGDADMGRQVTYVKNPDWWGADLPMNRGRRNFDAIRIEVFNDSTAAMEAFKAGVYTFRSSGSPKEWASDYNFPAVQRGDVSVNELPNGTIGGSRGLAFNLRRAAWQDPRTRDAVRMLFNFEWTNETLFYGFYERPYSFWGKTELAAQGIPDADETAVLEPLIAEGLLDASILETEAILPPVNDAGDNSPSRKTRRAALKLLNEAGWTAGSDGQLRNAAGEPLTLEIIQFDSNLDRVMNPFAANLQDVGIDAKLNRMDTAQYVERRRSRDWDLSNILPGQSFEPSAGMKQWFGSETSEDSSRNIMGLADPAVDRLIDTVVEAKTLEELKIRTRALDRVLRAHGFWLSQWHDAFYRVAYWDQYRHPEVLPELQLGVLDFWWYDAEAGEELRSSGALR